MTSQQAPHQTATAVPAPPIRDLVARVEQEKLPVSVGRRLASVVTGVATLGFGSLTGLLAALVFQNPAGKGGAFMLLAWLFVAFLAAATGGFAFLTWRWARSLPPMKSLALTQRERDELNSERS